MPRPGDLETVSVPEAVLLPGLVNVHTHLELTGFRGAVTDSEFFDWIQHIRRLKAETAPDAFVQAAREGLREAWSSGVTTLADTGDSGAGAVVLKELGGRGVAYQEVFGPHPDQAAESFRGLLAALERLRAGASGSVRIGVSPHAPYTVSEPLFRRVAELARSEALPLAVHLAESPEESAFVSRAAGPFADLWRRRGIPLVEQAASPVAYLDRCGVLGSNTLVIHAVQTSEGDRRTLGNRGCALALCPRSNARHGHGSAPIAAYVRDGFRLGLGTDSVASVESMDLFAEARAARDIAGLDAPRLIQMLTFDGARALGLEAEIGTLDVGKWADFCLLRLGATPILEAKPAHVVGTWVAGRRVYGNPRDNYLHHSES